MGNPNRSCLWPNCDCPVNKRTEGSFVCKFEDPDEYARMFKRKSMKNETQSSSVMYEVWFTSYGTVRIKEEPNGTLTLHAARQKVRDYYQSKLDYLNSLTDQQIAVYDSQNQKF